MAREVNQQNIGPLRAKIEAVTKIYTQESKRIEQTFWSNTTSILIHRLSVNTDNLRKLIEKQNEWIWTNKHTEVSTKPKEGITKIPCLAHYNAQNEKATTDANT